MSNHLISETYKRDLGTPMRKAVMVYFADKASDDGLGIYASKGTMAEELNAAKQSVRNTLAAFIAEGLVFEDGRKKCRNGYTVQYAIDVDKLKALPLVPSWQKKEDDRRARERSRGGEGSKRLTGPTPRPVNDVDVKGSKRLTQTLKEPVENQSGEKAARLVDNCPLSSRRLPGNLRGWQWAAYLEMRDACHKPIQRPGAILLLAKLEAFAGDWHLGDVVERATINCWTDFREPSAIGWTGVRRLVDGREAAPVHADATALERLKEIDRLDSEAARLEARAVYFARSPRRKEATAIGDAMGDLVANLERKRKDAR